jgi:hypothetical protein
MLTIKNKSYNICKALAYEAFLKLKSLSRVNIVAFNNNKNSYFLKET